MKRAKSARRVGSPCDCNASKPEPSLIVYEAPRENPVQGVWPTHEQAMAARLTPDAQPYGRVGMMSKQEYDDHMAMLRAIAARDREMLTHGEMRTPMPDTYSERGHQALMVLARAGILRDEGHGGGLVLTPYGRIYYLQRERVGNPVAKVAGPADMATMTREQLERLDFDDLSRAAFGVASDDEVEIPTSKIRIRWKADLENAIHDRDERILRHPLVHDSVTTTGEMRGTAPTQRAWAEAVLANAPPVEVDIVDAKGTFVLQDGHHRYVAAKLLRRPLRAIVQVKTNPINAILARRGENPVVLEPTKEGWQGQSRGVALSTLPQAELAVGTKHELEHVGSKRVAKRIAADHLVEDPHYYRHLAQMEAQHSIADRKGNPLLSMGPGVIDELATGQLRQVKNWPKKSRGDLTSAALVAGGYAQRTGRTAYVYSGNSYGSLVWRVSDKRSDYLSPINNTGSRILSITPDLTASWHELAREAPPTSEDDERLENPTKRKAVPSAQEECLSKVADGLLPFAKRAFGSNDVLVWRDGAKVRIAFRADALRIEAVYKQSMLYNRNLSLDIALQEAVGLDAKLVREGAWTGIKGGLGQILDEPQTHYAQVLDGVQQVASEVLRPCLGVEYPQPEVIAVFLPNEGGPLQPYYSARKRAWFAAEPEPSTSTFTVEVEDERGRRGPGQVIGVDVCSRYPRITDCGTDIEAVSGPEASDFFVVHATTPTPESSALVAKCGGFLFPSLGIGQLPSTTFGPLVLVAGVDLVLQALKPYRTTRKLPVHVYDTDTWTITSLAIPYAAHILYNQLTGQHEESVYGAYGGMGHDAPHQWVLGAPTSLTSVAGQLEAKVITSTRQLAKELAARARAWRGANAQKIMDRYGATKHRYPYLEAKVNGMLAASCFRLAVAPTSWMAASKAYMKKIGIDVPLLEVPDPPGTGQRLVGGGTKNITAQWLPPSPGDQDGLNFQRLVAQVIRDYATAHGLRRGYEL